MKLNIATLVVIVVAVVFFVMQRTKFRGRLCALPELPLPLPSFLLFVLARIQLGRAFSVQAKATTLVTTGLYSRIRNPIYVFGGVDDRGSDSSGSKSRGSCWSFVILIPLQVIRSRKEAQVLAEKFGAAYEEYKRQTWF